MVEGLSKVELSEYISQRGTGQAIEREGALVYDFMPVVLGDEFRTNDVLSRMLLRPAPKDAPFILQSDAYETLGLKYVDEENLVPALECYRIALNSRTTFAMFMARIQEAALLNQHEIDHLDVSTDLERKLVEEVVKSNGKHDQVAYNTWVEELRTAQKTWLELDGSNNYGSRKYVEACLRIGEYERAIANAESLGDENLIRRVKRVIPKEILDIKFLTKYINDNFPESTFGRESMF